MLNSLASQPPFIEWLLKLGRERYSRSLSPAILDRVVTTGRGILDLVSFENSHRLGGYDRVNTYVFSIFHPSSSGGCSSSAMRGMFGSVTDTPNIAAPVNLEITQPCQTAPKKRAQAEAGAERARKCRITVSTLPGSMQSAKRRSCGH